MRLVPLLVLAFLVSACTYNQINFETDSVRFSDRITAEPGSSGDDSGSNQPDVAGGTGKLSPGGSNLLDGSLQFALIIQQGGETPSSTPVTIDVSGLPGTTP